VTARAPLRQHEALRLSTPHARLAIVPGDAADLVLWPAALLAAAAHAADSDALLAVRPVAVLLGGAVVVEPTDNGATF
jgi:hypothetical protein